MQFIITVKVCLESVIKQMHRTTTLKLIVEYN